MHAQHRHLIEVLEMPNVTLQGHPVRCGRAPGHAGLFILLHFAEAAIPDVIYIDTMAGSSSSKKRVTCAGISACLSISVQSQAARTPLGR